MNLLIIIDYFSELDDWYKKRFVNYEEYYLEKVNKINFLIDYASRSSDFKILNAFYPSMSDRYNSAVSERANIDYDLIDFPPRSGWESGLIASSFGPGGEGNQQFDNIYYCGAALTQCVLWRPHGYMRADHPSKFLVKDAIFCCKGYRGYDVSRLTSCLLDDGSWPSGSFVQSALGRDLYELNSIDDVLNHEKEFLLRNNFNIITTEMICKNDS